MARIRTVKPDLFKNDELAELPALARLAFIGLWGQADRRGRLKDRPKKLKAEILPYDDCDFNSILSQLDKSEFIHRYESDGGHFIAIPNFEKHQRIAGAEADTESEYPEPPPRVTPSNIEETIEKQSRNTEETPETTGKEGKGKERKGREGDASASTPTPAEFVSTWNEFVPFSPIRSMSGNRQTALRARRVDPRWRRDWRTAVGKIRGSPFLRGENDRNWKADVDWFLRPDTVTKILEGKYDGKPNGKPSDGRIAADAGTIAKIRYFSTGETEGDATSDGASKHPTTT